MGQRDRNREREKEKEWEKEIRKARDMRNVISAKKKKTLYLLIPMSFDIVMRKTCIHHTRNHFHETTNGSESILFMASRTIALRDHEPKKKKRKKLLPQFR